MSKVSPAATEPLEPGEGVVSPPGSTDRVQRIERILGYVANLEGKPEQLVVINDERRNLTEFLDEDHGTEGIPTQVKVAAILKANPK